VRSKPVLIDGAGITGLVAATTLQRASQNIMVLGQDHVVDPDPHAVVLTAQRKAPTAPLATDPARITAPVP
jgi:2-polyprenyl-6-methoxyphenol hydroxylase-like FAD-dependent oxidoreductase